MSNRTKNILLVIMVAILLLSSGVDILKMFHKVPRGTFNEKAYFDSVFYQLQRAHDVDSMMDLRDNRIIDSMRVIYKGLSAEFRANRIRLNRLDRSNEALRHKLDSLMPVSRPDF